MQACAVTGGDGTDVRVFVCCNVGCTGAPVLDLASRSRSLSAASLSCMMAIEEYGDSQKLRKLVVLRWSVCCTRRDKGNEKVQQ